MSMRTETYTFGGFNINDKRVMSDQAVAEDLNTVRRMTDVAVVVELRWKSYWAVAKQMFTRGTFRGWESWPTVATGTANSTWAAQVVMWDSNQFKCKKRKRKSLHEGIKKVSEARSIRAALLTSDGVDCWYGTTHFVVAGDDEREPDKRNAILLKDMDATASFWDKIMKAGGPPVIFQLDANIRPGTWGYREFTKRIKWYNGRIIGTHGIEYLIVFDAHSKTKVIVKGNRQVNMNSPHEGRLITYCLETRP